MFLMSSLEKVRVMELVSGVIKYLRSWLARNSDILRLEGIGVGCGVVLNGFVKTLLVNEVTKEAWGITNR